METTFLWRGACIERHGLTVRDRNTKVLLRDMLVSALFGDGADEDAIDAPELFNIIRFVDMVVSCHVVDGEFPFSIPQPKATAEELIKAYHAYSALPEDFIDAFDAAERVLIAMGKSAIVEKKDSPLDDSSSTPSSTSG